MSAQRSTVLALALLFVACPLFSHQKSQPDSVPSATDPAASFVAQGSKLYLAQKYKQAIGPYQKALDLEKQKSTLSPDLVRMLVDNLGISYGLTGDLKHSREVFEFGIARDPTYPIFHYNLACTYAEMDDLDRALSELGLAYRYKQNTMAGQEFPDPRLDDSFQRYLKNRRFLDFLKSVEQQPAGKNGSSPAAQDSSNPPAIRGTLLHTAAEPIAGAQVTLQVFDDEACAKLFDAQSDSPQDSEKLSTCSRDLFTVQSDAKGEFVFSGVQPGWYAVRFLWNIDPKPSSGPSADHISGFLVIYAAQPDVSGRYDTLSQGPAFHFDAARDYSIEFKY